jgi:hypothetical protein
MRDARLEFKTRELEDTKVAIEFLTIAGDGLRNVMMTLRGNLARDPGHWMR